MLVSVIVFLIAEKNSVLGKKEKHLLIAFEDSTKTHTLPLIVKSLELTFCRQKLQYSFAKPNYIADY